MNTQNYAVNIRVGLANPVRVNISQGDTGRTLAFSLYDGLSPFTPPTGSTVTIVGRKPSKLGFSETCTVSGNVATVATTLAMTQEAGKFPAELRIEAGGQSIGTANFTMYVEPSPHPDGTTDGTHATVDNLQTQIGNLANLTTTAKTNLVSAINEAAQSGGTEVVIDNTLTQTGQAADAKKTGDEISAIKADLEDLDDRVEALESGSGMTEGVKTALMNLVNHIAWDDDDPTGQTYITALYNALYPPADLVSISAVYTQSGTVYDTDTLDSLKSDLVVTALMSDQTTRTITDYTLSGTLTEGTSTITVSYGGQTATFNVTVSTHLMYSLYNHEFTGDMSVSPVIDTGIQFFDEDFSWTIICELNKETAYTHGWRLFGALQDTSPYNGFYHGSSNNTASGNTNVKWINSTTSSANTYMKGNWTGTYKCAFVHNFGGGLSEYFKGNNDSVITKSLSNAWLQISDANTLEIGGIPGVPAAALIGTIVKCEIYDYAFSSSEINAFMEGAS